MKEKSQIEKNAEERQIELLSTALNEASNAGGHWLNATGKGFPKFYPKGVAVSPFNGLFMALHSDRNGCKDFCLIKGIGFILIMMPVVENL